MSESRARGHLVALWAGSLCAAILLPGPAEILGELGDPRAAVVLGAVVSVPTAALSYLLAGWGTLAAVVGGLAHLPSATGAAARRVLALITPVAAHRIVGLALGLAILGSAPAYAAAPGVSPDIGGPVTGGAALPVIAVDLDWPTHTGRAASGPASYPAGGADDAPAAPRARTVPHAPPGPTDRPDSRADRVVVTVTPGDCLWAIAAGQLARTASPAQIDAAWRAWYEENRDVIGPDPDLLTPGQRLRAPADPITAAPVAAAHHRGGSS